jgi:hypothetical protein
VNYPHKEYRVHGCIQTVDGGKSFVERVSDINAAFFGVYEVQTDGTELWVADFDKRDDAQIYVEEQNG